LIKNGQGQLLKNIRELISERTKIILIAAPVFIADFDFLINHDIPIINKELIDFPGSGCQIKSKIKMKTVLEQNYYLI
jgi:hypothetical protein